MEEIMESTNKYEISTTKELGRYIKQFKSNFKKKRKKWKHNYRHAVAGKELKPGELILCEKPIVVGLYWGSDLCCLSCYGQSMTVCK